MKRWTWLLAMLVAPVATSCGGGGEGGGGGPVEGASGTGGAAPEVPGAPEPKPTKSVSSLVITSPARGAFLSANAEGSVLVEGRGASAGLTINGAAVEVAADGTFRRPVAATPGLNVVRAVDGDDEVGTPFLYGTFAPKGESAAGAVVARVNAAGLAADSSAGVGLSALLAQVLASDATAGVLVGQEFDSFGLRVTIDEAAFEAAEASLAPRAGGLRATILLKNVVLRGPAQFHLGPIPTPTFHVTMTTDARVEGDVDVGAAPGGGVTVTMAAAPKVTLSDPIRFDTSIPVPGIDQAAQAAVNFFRGRIEEAIATKVEQTVSSVLNGVLGNLTLGGQVDLRPRLDVTLDVSGRLDGAGFDPAGGFLSLAGRVDAPFPAGGPAEGAPGWLRLAGPPGAFDAAPPFGVSLSADVINQALYSVWGANALALGFENVPVVGALKLDPKMPPVVTVKPDGSGLRLGVGELAIDTQLNGTTLKAALSASADVTLAIDPDGSALRLAPVGAPDLSITWLEGGAIDEGLKAFVEKAAREYLPSVIPPVAVPLPSIPLGALPGLEGKSLGLAEGAELRFDGASSRLTIYGDFVLR